MTAPNLVNTAEVYMRSNIQLPLSTSATDILETPAASNMVIRADTLTVCNTTAAAISFDVYLVRSSVSYAIAKTITVPAYSSLVTLDKDYPVYLKEGDKLQVQASAWGLQAICAYTIISDTGITLPGRPTINTGITLTYIGSADVSTDGTSFTFSNIAIGTPSEDRLVVAVIATTGGASGISKTSLTINGNAMNDVHNIVNAFGNQNVAYYRLSEGITANIAISFEESKNRSTCAIYTITGQTSDTPLDTDSSVSASSLTVDLPDGTAGVFGFSATGTTVTTTWSGATEDLDKDVGGEGTTSISTASARDQTTSHVVTLTHSSTPSAPIYTAAVWG